MMAALSVVAVEYKTLRNFDRLKRFMQPSTVVLKDARYNHMFKHLAKTNKHENNYNYKVSEDPKEWEFVEKLMPLETVPIPKQKSNYPSGWRPPKEEALNNPYYVERSKNHMLSVYLKVYNRKQGKATQVSRIQGDLWRLHDELKAYIEEQAGKKIASYVLEGNNAIVFKGDHVYFAEQWLLSKGF